MTPEGRWSDALLNRMREAGDPMADRTVIRLLELDPTLAEVNTLLARLDDDPARSRLPDSPIGRVLGEYLEATGTLPDWADPRQIAVAETLFVDHGLLAVVCLFCASLPECYVLEHEAEVLHLAGQLERHVHRRIRETGRMVFPVMDRGGLGPGGQGVRNIQKVRLIHATIRQLIQHRHEPRFAGGPLWNHLAQAPWDPKRGVPINQEQLAYTLLTFGYVFVRSWPACGVRVSPEQERAYLHIWNVAGHVIGMERELMVHTMEDAAALFARIQLRCRMPPDRAATGRALASALVTFMETTIPARPFKPFAPLTCRALLGDATADLLAIDRHVSWPARMAFGLTVRTLRLVEAALRAINSQASPLRLLYRVLARHFLRDYLLSQTRPLVLRPELEGEDRHQWGWLRWVERRLAPAAPGPRS
jgi:hypothetical protein